MQHHPGSWYLPWGVPLQKMVAVPIHPAAGLQQFNHPALVQPAMLAGLPAPLTSLRTFVTQPTMRQPTQRKVQIIQQFSENLMFSTNTIAYFTTSRNF